MLNIKSLLKFTHLNSLNLSGTSVSLTPGISRIQKLMSFGLVSYVSIILYCCLVINNPCAITFFNLKHLYLRLLYKLFLNECDPARTTINLWSRAGIELVSSLSPLSIELTSTEILEALSDISERNRVIVGQVVSLIPLRGIELSL